jgi:hypothetical protein
MAPTKIPSGTTEYDILDNARTYLLDNSDTLNVAGANGIYASDMIFDDTIVIKGAITQTGDGFAGIWTDGTNMTIHIETGGSVTGDTGIASENPEPHTRLNIINDGEIIGSGGYAIDTQDSKENVVNNGTIHGRIYLGSGNDVFDNRNGTIDHKVEGGAGDDTLITDNANTRLKENGGSEGFDTVKASASYTLSENVERLILIGNANLKGWGTEDGNVLQGNSGNNKLWGVDGSGSDLFIFKTGGGHDTLMDFDAGIDEIDVSHWTGMDNFHDIKQHMADQNGDVHITLGGADELIIKDTSTTDLHAGDFSFASSP